MVYSSSSQGIGRTKSTILQMLTLLLIAVAVDASELFQNAEYCNRNLESCVVMTTSAGVPIEGSDTSTLNSNLIHNEYFMDSITHLDKERTPERVVHGNGAGAFGYFEVTNDITNICKAKLFSAVGKKTRISIRFSTIIAERDGIDTSRDGRGFAVKFYTEDGNFDIVGLNFPVFVIKDPILFTTFVHSLKRDPATHLRDSNRIWDFLTSRPESLNNFMRIFSDRGVPDGYRHMPGFGIHTFQVSNERGESSFVRFHFYPDAGIKNLFTKQAQRIAGTDPDYAIRDLYKSIENGNFPSWTMSIQILSLEDVKNASFDVFDVTKALPLDKYPLWHVGRLVLNRNPNNYFAEVEQLAFCPGNLVPGVLGAPDKLFEARRLSYRDTLSYRLGVNFNKILVNKPITVTHTYNRDGSPPVGDNEKNTPNYYPNSYNGQVSYLERNRAELLKIYQDEPNIFEQASEFYMNEITIEERSRLVQNILDSLAGVTKSMEDKAVRILARIHADLGRRIDDGLQRNITIAY